MLEKTLLRFAVIILMVVTALVIVQAIVSANIPFVIAMVVVMLGLLTIYGFTIQ